MYFEPIFGPALLYEYPKTAISDACMFLYIKVRDIWDGTFCVVSV